MVSKFQLGTPRVLGPPLTIQECQGTRRRGLLTQGKKHWLGNSTGGFTKPGHMESKEQEERDFSFIGKRIHLPVLVILPQVETLCM